ncbi:hypothetical protein HCB18_05890 [Salinispora arenicola]|uniref:hypothetical protein n=1 Tax=Salinispora arenicola TaxID=168697 RepID=UPI0016B97567|nr:hypothetical protein [Salinispora arenicola]NIL56522.1 hypothetical protein [Salinispora arenicola]
MATAQTGSAVTRSAARAGCMPERRDDYGTERRGTRYGRLPTDTGQQAVPASQPFGADGTGDGGIRRYPTDPGELRRPLVDTVAGEGPGESNDAEAKCDAELNGSGQQARSERRE